MGLFVGIIAVAGTHHTLRQGGDVGLVGQNKLLQQVSSHHSLLWGVRNPPETDLRPVGESLEFGKITCYLLRTCSNRENMSLSTQDPMDSLMGPVTGIWWSASTTTM